MKLIPKAKTAGAVKIILASIILAFAEIASVSFLLPLLFQFLNSYPLHPLLVKLHSIHWAVFPISVIFLFATKNFLSTLFLKNQLKYLDELYIEFIKKIYRDFFQQNWASYGSKNTVDTFRKIKTTPYEFTHTVLLNYFNLVTDLTTCAIIILAIAFVNYQVLLVLIIFVLPMLALITLFKKKKVASIDQSFRDLTPKTNIVLAQGIDSFVEAKLYNKQNYFIDQFVVLSTKTTQQLSWLKVMLNLPGRISEFVGVLSFAFLLVLAQVSPLSKDDILFLFLLISVTTYRIVPSLNRIVSSTTQIRAYKYAVNELRELLEINLGPTSQDVTIDFSHTIQLSSVSFRYKKTSSQFSLHDINCVIEKGDFVVIEGRSGGGKTTLLYLLAGLIEPDNGHMSIDGEMLRSAHIRNWQNKVALVPQSPVILQGTICENIAFGQVVGEISNTRVQETLELVGLANFVDSLPLGMNTMLGEDGKTISGGQRQRLALARALYRNAEVLLLDEVTNQLDELTKQEVISTLRQLNRAGKTIILISHDTAIKKFANRVFKVSEGSLSESTL